MSSLISLSNLNRFFLHIKNLLAGKQDTLVSGSNIATINGQSLLNGGDIKILVNGSSGDLTVADEASFAYSAQYADSAGRAESCEEASLALKANIADELTYTILYNSTVNYNNITLSNTVADFTFIDIYGQTDSGVILYIRLFQPNGKQFSLDYNTILSGNYTTSFKTFSISGTTISSVSGGVVSTTSNNKHEIETVTDNIGIVTVIGYK